MKDCDSFHAQPVHVSIIMYSICCLQITMDDTDIMQLSLVLFFLCCDELDWKKKGHSLNLLHTPQQVAIHCFAEECLQAVMVESQDVTKRHKLFCQA